MVSLPFLLVIHMLSPPLFLDISPFLSSKGLAKVEISYLKTVPPTPAQMLYMYTLPELPNQL